MYKTSNISWMHLSLLCIFTYFCSIFYASAAQNSNSCSLLSKSDIQAVLGQNVEDRKPNSKANPAGGIPCEYKIVAGGYFSIVIKDAAQGENPENVKRELKKRKIAVTDASGIGDGSFYSSPGYGMVQLNTFKGKKYIIITMLIPNSNEAAQKIAAEKLMRKAISNI